MPQGAILNGVSTRTWPSSTNWRKLSSIEGRALLWRRPAKVRIERIERQRKQKMRQGEERRLEGGDVERNKGRRNGSVGEATKAMRVKVDIGGVGVQLVAQWMVCAREMFG